MTQKFTKHITKGNLLLLKVSKPVYIDKLDDIVNKYTNIYHSTIKMKPVVVKSKTYIVFN